MTTERLQVNPNFFNKLDSLYKGKGKKIITNFKKPVEKKTVEKPKVKSDTFGSTPISVISDNTKKKNFLQIPDNTQRRNKKIIPKSKVKREIINVSSSDKEFEIIEDQILGKKLKRVKYQRPKASKGRRENFGQKYNNSFHLYDDNNSMHIVAKLDKKNPLYNKIIDLPFQDLINISYYNKFENKYFSTYLIIFFICGLFLGITITFNFLQI